jgi:hypothetical protein
MGMGTGGIPTTDNIPETTEKLGCQTDNIPETTEIFGCPTVVSGILSVGNPNISVVSVILSVGHPNISVVSGIFSVVGIPPLLIPIPEEIQLLMYDHQIDQILRLDTDFYQESPKNLLENESK